MVFVFFQKNFQRLLCRRKSFVKKYHIFKLFSRLFTIGFVIFEFGSRVLVDISSLGMDFNILYHAFVFNARHIRLVPFFLDFGRTRSYFGHEQTYNKCGKESRKNATNYKNRQFRHPLFSLNAAVVWSSVRCDN